MAKTWQEKYQNPPHSKVEVLEKPAFGVSAGAKMLISTPAEIEKVIRRIPKGETRTIIQLRATLAEAAGADVTCPLTTGIFLRIVAEVAWEEFEAGRDPAPFWRVVDPRAPLAKKLRCGTEFIAEQRRQELA
jgi:hypothetical protein